MGSAQYHGIRFQCFSNDHAPAHVHAFYNGVVVIVELLADGGVMLAARKDAVMPKKAKRSYVRYILTVAAEQAEALVALWEEIHGEAE